jgi:aerobic-type carbon monoxide dehydrogenase small subunit (CoxS/CutS family)
MADHTLRRDLHLWHSDRYASCAGCRAFDIFLDGSEVVAATYNKVPVLPRESHTLEQSVSERSPL